MPSGAMIMHYFAILTICLFIIAFYYALFLSCRLTAEFFLGRQKINVFGITFFYMAKLYSQIEARRKHMFISPSWQVINFHLLLCKTKISVIEVSICVFFFLYLAMKIGPYLIKLKSILWFPFIFVISNIHDGKV